MTYNIPKLRWNCRRGMLELDLLLLPFLDNVFSTLTSADQQLFEELLACTDQDLYTWLIGHERPSDHKFDELIKRVRNGI